MLVRMKTLYCGPRGTFVAGAELDLPDAEAKMLVARGYAEAVEEVRAPAPEPESTAQAGAPEQAILPAARKRR